MHSEPRASAAHASVISKRIAALRTWLTAHDLTGFVVPHADENQSEYLPASAERLAWLTGFTGSAGMAIVLQDRAAIFVDGRYTLQVRGQVPGDVFSYEHLIETPPSRWLGTALKAGDRIGYDPWLLTVREVRRLGEACRAAEATFVAVDMNPIDAIWDDRPAAPAAAVSLQPTALAGEDATAKIARIQAAIGERKADAVVIAEADSVAWLLNIRGSDIPHSPVALSFLLLPREGKPTLFIDGRKLSNSVRATLSEIVDVAAPGDLLPTLAVLGARKAKVQIDVQATAEAIARTIRDAGGTIIEASDPVALPRARKNPIEIAGARKAHVRDGAAMVRFLCWLDEHGAGLDEVTVSDRLAALRAETALRDGSELVDLPFDTISGAGANGAIVHYRADPATAGILTPGSLYLVDSGAQYRDGTTDITRTVAIGTPTDEMRDRFTRVLKGHIAIATARFPVGTSGAQLDALARLPLWQAGLDFDHGTGHGVGSFLSVHEGPVRISKSGTVALEPGMILSDEPGYYKAGEYGIRIENLVLVLPASDVAGGERPMMSFEVLTFAPIDRRLIVPALLSDAEIAWIDAYHAGLASKLGHLLDTNETDWLAAATRPLRR